MSRKRIQRIERKIDRIERALTEFGPMRPGSPVQGSPTPRRGVLEDRLYPPDEEPHGVRPPGMGDRASPPDRDSQAVQTSGGPLDRLEYRALTADHADSGT